MMTLSLLLLLAPVASAPAPPDKIIRVSRTPDPQALTAALDLHGREEFKRRALEGALGLAMTVLDTDLKAREKRGFKVPQELASQLRAFVLEDLTSTFDEMGDALHRQSAAVYARHFTAGELRELKVLMANPLMRKLDRISPAMNRELAQIGMRASATRAAERRRRLKEMIDDWQTAKRLPRRTT